MNSSAFRAEARKNLSGKWGKAVLIALAFGFFSWAISLVEKIFPAGLSFLVSIGKIVIEIPLSFGLTKAYVKLYNGEDVSAFDFISLGFNEFTKSWGIAFGILVKVLVPFILMVVGYFMMFFGLAAALTSSIFNNAAAAQGASYSSAISSISTGFSIVGIIGALLFFISAIWYTVKSYYYQLSYIIASENENISNKDAVTQSRELMDGKRGKLFVLQLSFIGWAFLCIFTLGIGYLWLAPYMQFAIIAFYKFVSGQKANTQVVNSAEITDAQE